MNYIRARLLEPSDHEQTVGATVERLFGDGVADLDGLCDGLNRAAVPDPAGALWQPQSLAAFLASLP